MLDDLPGAAQLLILLWLGPPVALLGFVVLVFVLHAVGADR